MRISSIINKEELWSQYSSLLPYLKDKKAEEDDSLEKNIKSTMLTIYKGIYKLYVLYTIMQMKVQSSERSNLLATNNLGNILLPRSKFIKKNELEIGGISCLKSVL